MASAKKPPAEIRSDGQRLLMLSLSQLSLSEVGKQVGLAKVTVRSHSIGEYLPRPEQQREYMRVLGIPPAAWTRPPGAPTRPAEDAPPRPPAAPQSSSVGSSLDEAMAYLLRVQEARQQAEADGVPGDALKWAALEHKAIEQVAKLRGDLSPADETRLTQTPRWAAVRGCIIEALRPHPRAREDVIRALTELDAMGGAQ